ncbi:hypothetical protein [Nocardioides sp.]|uniref:hypothetical protein n=1 Tax=Nocardioides sp. TaxID=35761 RepID=UPI00272146AE|nr:hypothetical protein [Nocardioides sp.]MDO9457873.1 hypothetical protein [Nocardioides sp.]
MLRRTAPALLLTLALTACDAGESPEPAATPTSTATTQDDEQAAPVADAVRRGVAALYVGDHPTPEQVAEGECFADALLQRLDGDALAAAGIVQDDGAVAPAVPALDVATAEAWVAAQGDCTDFVEVSSRALVAQSKGKVAADVYADCLREALTDDEVDQALVDTLTGRFDTPAVTALSEAQARCAGAASPPE